MGGPRVSRIAHRSGCLLLLRILLVAQSAELSAQQKRALRKEESSTRKSKHFCGHKGPRRPRLCPRPAWVPGERSEKRRSQTNKRKGRGEKRPQRMRATMRPRAFASLVALLPDGTTKQYCEFVFDEYIVPVIHHLRWSSVEC